ncbi:Hypothetical predicted protein, partial [Paramuricea clavata]
MSKFKGSKKRDLKHQESSSSMTVDKIIAKMEDGMTMTRFYPTGKRKPENRVYYVNVARMIFYWTRPDRHDRPVEGSVKIREVKVIRKSNFSKDFEKNVDYLKKVDSNCCLVILYGTTFNLKSLSCIAQTAQECSYWVEGLTHLMNKNVPHPTVVSRWLQMEWNMLVPIKQNGITMKELKTFLIRSNIKMNVAEMTEKIKKLDVNNNAVIDFKGFKAFYESLMNQQAIGKYFYTLSKDNWKNVLFKHFKSFLMMEQK